MGFAFDMRGGKMGKIVEQAKNLKAREKAGQDAFLEDMWESLFRTIEDQIKEVKNQYELIKAMLEVKKIAFPDEFLVDPWTTEIARLEQKICDVEVEIQSHIDDIQSLKNGQGALKDEIEQINKQIDDLTTRVYLRFRSIVTDKDGKPEGGLQKGDLVRHKEFGYGILDEPKASIFPGGKLPAIDHAFSGWFEGIDSDKPIMVSRKNITFILRPSKDC